LVANSIPSINIQSSHSVVCSGDSVTLTALGANLFTWGNFSNLNYITVTPTANTIYSVTGVNIYSCSNSSTISINPSPNPTLTIVSSNPTICAREISVLGVAGANTYTWSNLIVGANNTISPMTTSVFSVTGTDANGCISSTSITQIVDVCLNTTHNDLFPTSNFIYPNPTNGHFNISFDSSENFKSIVIYNTIGEQILQIDIQNNDSAFDITNFPTGLYQIRLISYEKTIFAKIIKQ
jgi:hypothetical protein